MQYQLVVKHPLGPYQIGDHITDPADVAKYGASHPEFVVRKPLLEAVPSDISTASPASPNVPQLPPIK